MIQRIQSVWLLLAALTSGALFISPLYRYDTAGGEQLLQTTGFYPLLIIAAIMTLLPLAAIFMYKERKRQRGMVIGALFACLGFLGVMWMKTSNIQKEIPAPTGGQYAIPGALLPAVAIIFLMLAIRGINKDEKLVRSMDRLR